MDSNNYYRKVEGARTILAGHVVDHVTATSTPQSSAGNALEGDNCVSCHAAWGHKAICPTINRNVAEAYSALTPEDVIRLKGLGVTY